MLSQSQNSISGVIANVTAKLSYSYKTVSVASVHEFWLQCVTNLAPSFGSGYLFKWNFDAKPTSEDFKQRFKFNSK